MDSKYAKVFAVFDTSVYDEEYFKILEFLREEFGERRTIRTIKDTKKRLFEWKKQQKSL